MSKNTTIEYIQFIINLPFFLPGDGHVHTFPYAYKFIDPKKKEIEAFTQIKIINSKKINPEIFPPAYVNTVNNFMGRENLAQIFEPTIISKDYLPPDTGVCLTTPFHLLEHEQKLESELIDICLLRSLESLNSLILAFQIKDSEKEYKKFLRPINIETLHYILLCKKIKCSASQKKDTDLQLVQKERPFSEVYIINNNIQTLHVEDDNFRNVTDFTTIIHDRHPCIIHRKWFEKASYQYNINGNYSEAIIFLHTSVEVLLFQTLQMIYIDLNKTKKEWEEKISSKEKRISFKTIKDDLIGEEIKLGGDWESENSPHKKYMQGVYKLRNESVHRGHEVTFEECKSAFEYFNDFSEFILFRLARNITKYQVANAVISSDKKLREFKVSDKRIEGLSKYVSSLPHPIWSFRDSFVVFIVKITPENDIDFFYFDKEFNLLSEEIKRPVKEIEDLHKSYSYLKNEIRTENIYIEVSNLNPYFFNPIERLRWIDKDSYLAQEIGQYKNHQLKST